MVPSPSVPLLTLPSSRPSPGPQAQIPYSRIGFGCLWLGSLWAMGLAIGANAQPITSDGEGTIVTPIATPQGSEYQITGGTQSGGNLFHSFGQFGLGAGQVANFIGSPELSNILGRVTGGEASVINGLLQVSNSNANLYLMNPAGLILGPGASLDLKGSFTGTTATAIGFEQGWLNASGPTDYAVLVGSPNQFQFAAATATGGEGLPGGSIVNLGNLSVAPGQDLALLGRAVFNSGNLSAPGGQIAVIAIPGPGIGGETGAETQVLRYTEPGMILGLELLTVPTGTNPMTLANLEPSQLPAYLTGGNLANASALIVEADGTVRLAGATVPAEAGAVMVSGVVDAASATGIGGDVVMTGDVVGLLDATVTAAGQTGGGNLRIGGDYQGGGRLPTAEAVYVDAASELRADAATIGDGGEIIVWADHSTRFYGMASAQGGALGGNGGLVETSGKIFLDVAGATVNTSAIAGATGTWLLDPMNLTIQTGVDEDITGFPNFNTTGIDGSATLSTSTLESALSSNNVTITTAGGGGGDGDITLAGTINATGGNDLTLTARRFVLNSGAINLRDAGADLIFYLNQVNPEPIAPTSSIQAAHDSIGTVAGTKTIVLSPGTFSGATLTLSKGITLRGSGQTQTILDGENSRTVVQNSAGENTIEQLTIRNGNTTALSGGGGIHNSPSGGAYSGSSPNSLTLNTVSVINNRSSSPGGGITNGSYSQLILNNSIISNNVADGNGGGIHNESDGTVTLNNSVLESNTAQSGGAGGGIYNGSSGTLTLNNTTLSGNYASNRGGGIYNSIGGTATLSSSIVRTNTAIGDGGGMASGGTTTLQDTQIIRNQGNLGGGLVTVGSSSDTSILQSTLSDNRAFRGGGIYVFNGGTLTLTQSTIAGNQAGVGGGIVNDQGTVSLDRSTLSGNTSESRGGGISNFGTTTLVNSTVSGNRATLEGGGIDSRSNPYITGGLGANLSLTNTTIAANTTTTAGNTGAGIFSGDNTTLRLGNTLVADNTAAGASQDVFGSTTSLSLTLEDINLVETGNLSGTGLITNTDPLLSVLGNYGGPTQTHLLLPGSPALDRGPATTLTTNDQRGGNRIAGTGLDLGAVELQGVVLTLIGGTGQSTVVNTNFVAPLVVSATESTFSNLLSGGTITFSAPTTGPSLSLSSTSAVLDATSRTNLVALANRIAGSFTVTATAGTASQSFSLTNLAGAPSNLLILGGNNQSTIVNTAFSSPLSVRVTDPYGNPISGTLVAFTAPLAGASGQNTNLSLSTDSSGTVSTAYSANTIAGRYPVTSTVANTSLRTTFRLTNLADAPSVLTIDNGNNQVATIDSPFPTALTVRVTDQYGNPVAGVPVNFSIQSGTTGATGLLDSTSGTSNALGLVSTTLKASGNQGSFRVIASATGLNTSATFDLQNIIFSENVCPPTCDESIAENNSEPTNVVKAPNQAPVLTLPNAVVTEVLDNATFVASETVQVAAFSNHLNIPAPGPLNVEEAQNIIRERDRETGTTTAYITSRFTPVITENNTSTGKLTPNPRILSTATPNLPAQHTGNRAVSLGSVNPNPASGGNKELDPLTPWLGQLPGGETSNPDDRLEVIVMTATGEPQLKRLPVTRRQVTFLTQQIQQDLDKPIGVYKRRMQALYVQIFEPLEAELQALGVDNLLLSLGDDLRSIPWGALYDGEQFLVEKYSIGVTPSLSLTDTEFVSLRDRNVLAMGASEFTNQNALPAVPIELETIIQQLGVPSYFLNQAFTEVNLRQQRQALLPGVIHLATHANFLPGDLGQSYIQLWGNERISLDNLNSFQWFTDPPVELLVLSACRTALGDPQAELGFGGLAVKAGVRSALASLWYVSDAGTLALMTEFYRNLRDPAMITKGQALQKAQIALIRGELQVNGDQLRGGGSRSPYSIPLPPGNDTLSTEVLAHPYYWAAFTLIGSPW